MPKTFPAAAILLLLLVSTGAWGEEAAPSETTTKSADRKRLLAELNSAKEKEQRTLAAQVKKLETRAADVEKRLGRIRKARNPNAATQQKYEAEAALVQADIAAQQAKVVDLDQVYEQKRRRILLANKLPGDPPLVEHHGRILTAEELAAARADDNRPQPTAQQREQVKTLLAKARRLLAEREIAAAQAAVAEAQQAAGEFDLQGVIAPTESLVHYVAEFWKSYDAALPGVSGSEVRVGETVVFVVETGRDHIMIRKAGANLTYNRKTVPAWLARKITQTWLADEANSRVIVGAFLVADPTLVAHGGRESARAMWKAAAAAKADVGDLMKLLDEPARK